MQHDLSKNQTTIKNVVSAIGVGVHTGKQAKLSLCPAPPDTGIIFRRVDLNPIIQIPAHIQYLGSTNLSTSLKRKHAWVMMTEHLLSALSGIGIDNLYVDLQTMELPIMDGSAAPFIFLLQSAGIKQQTLAKRFIRIKRKICVKGDNGGFAMLEPYEGFKVTTSIDFKHPHFNEKNKKMSLVISETSYRKELSRARTFGFLSQYEEIKKRNLALGTNLNNTIVLGDKNIVNTDGLRYENECVKHKMLDAIGDLYLTGLPLLGAFSSHKAGHKLNTLLVKKMFDVAIKDWDIITLNNEKDLLSTSSVG